MDDNNQNPKINQDLQQLLIEGENITDLAPFDANIDGDKPDILMGDDFHPMVAQFDKIESVKEINDQVSLSKKYVRQIIDAAIEINKSKLIFNDAQISYFVKVAQFQIQALSEIKYLMQVNRKVIENIIHRINAESLEEVEVVNTFAKLTANHMKFIQAFVKIDENINKRVFEHINQIANSGSVEFAEDVDKPSEEPEDQELTDGDLENIAKQYNS